VDLLIGGSPCQSFSNAVTDNTGFLGKSGLFWEYIRILRESKPEYFLLENVPMKPEWESIITEAIGVEPVTLNSAYFSPQSRERLYWTNIPLGKLPNRNTQVLGDILEKNVPEKYFYKEPYTLTGTGGVVEAILHINGNDIIKRVNSKYHKCQTLTAVCGGNQHKKVIDNGRVRKLTPTEYERLQGLSDGYTFGVSDSQRYKMLGNGWNIPTIKYIFKYLDRISAI
jgi:DNA (cytosine-5)-methyltransferase 3A